MLDNAAFILHLLRADVFEKVAICVSASPSTAVTWIESEADSVIPIDDQCEEDCHCEVARKCYWTGHSSSSKSHADARDMLPVVSSRGEDLVIKVIKLSEGDFPDAVKQLPKTKSSARDSIVIANNLLFRTSPLISSS